MPSIIHENTPLMSSDVEDSSSRSFAVSFSSFAERLGSERRDAVLKKHPGLGHAAHLIRDVIIGAESSLNYYDPYSNPDERIRNVLYTLSSHLYVRLKAIEVAAYLGLIVVGILEPPHWCREIDHDVVLSQNDDDDGFGNCGLFFTAHDPTDASVTYYPNFNSMFLTMSQSRYMEQVCILVLAVFLCLRLGHNGFYLNTFFFRSVSNSLRFFLLILLFFKTSSTAFDPLFRLILVGTYLGGFQKEIWSLTKLLHQISYIWVVLAIVVAFYSFAGVLLFDASPQGERDFPNWLEGCWTLWICITTANYPDVMMPSFNNNRLSSIFFVSFMLISYFFLANLALAVVVEGYNSATDQRKRQEETQRNDDLKMAFDLMDPGSTGSIDKETITTLFMVLKSDFPEIPMLSEEETGQVFELLDEDNSASISLEEFMEFGVELIESIQKVDDVTFLQAKFPRMYECLNDRRNRRLFDQIIDVALLLNAILLIIQSYPQLSGQETRNQDQSNISWEVVQKVFTVIFTLEVITKILFFGWKRYISRPRNAYDFIVTISVLVSTAYVYYPNHYDDSQLINVVVLLRVLRLGRVLMSFPPFRGIASVSVQVLPRSKNIMQLLFFVIYFFACIGQILFGGLITRDPQNPHSKALLMSEFADNEYWGNNFNDIMSGMNVLFNLLIVNNWTECEIGFEVVVGKWARAFFFLFHIIGVVLINNLVCAFIITVFMDQWEKEREKEDSLALTHREFYPRFRF